MRAADLGSRRVAVWGLGREGRAAIGFVRKHHPALPLVLLDDAVDARPPDQLGGGIEYAFGADRIARALETIDVIIKSPGVSLYRREIQTAGEKGIHVTSLLNLWFAEQLDIVTICVTGTKGKSTTASLIAHMLARLGRRAALVGNIGVPITEIDSATADYAVIEVSSYQAADFDGVCDVAVLTSLYPEHIDWHLSVERYFHDKANLLNQSRCPIVNFDAADIIEKQLTDPAAFQRVLFNHESGIHARSHQLFDDMSAIGHLSNPYLGRCHNRSNLCAALAVIKSLGIEPAAALAATRGFRGLPHRQQELGEIGGLLFVDDSISTIPESTIAALKVYAGRDVAVIVGGYDRGIEYGKLVETVLGGAARAIICLGDSGQRIYALAKEVPTLPRSCEVHRAGSMADAVSFAKSVTPQGGVVLLSPAAPSYGSYRDYIERGRDFAGKAGFSVTSERSSHSSVE